MIRFKIPENAGQRKAKNKQPRLQKLDLPVITQMVSPGPAVQHSNVRSLLKRKVIPSTYENLGDREFAYIGGHRLVHGTPPNILVRTLLFHDALVEG